MNEDDSSKRVRAKPKEITLLVFALNYILIIGGDSMYKLYKEHLKEAYEYRNATLLSSRTEAYDMGARLYFTWCWMEWDKRCNYLENLSLLQKIFYKG